MSLGWQDGPRDGEDGGDGLPSVVAGVLNEPLLVRPDVDDDGLLRFLWVLGAVNDGEEGVVIDQLFWGLSGVDDTSDESDSVEQPEPDDSPDGPATVDPFDPTVLYRPIVEPPPFSRS